MQIRYPSFYHDFTCLAGQCPDSCCKEWAVVVDPQAEALYRSLPGELGDALREAMVTEDGDTILALRPDRRCPMWRDDGLCRIQAQLGQDGLCHTCRQFPRLRHDYGDFVELGLELSCPEAARLLLTQEYETVTIQADGGEAPEYDREAMEILLQTRESALAILADPTLSPCEALAALLLYGYHAQEILDGGEDPGFSPATAVKEAKCLAADAASTSLLALYLDLEILTSAWKERLLHPQGSDWRPAHRALARYFVERYWLQAVSDYDLVGRVKLCVVSVLVIKLLGGSLTDTAQLYSKEIENDADNVDALLDAAYTAPAMADIRLLGLLLEV